MKREFSFIHGCHFFSHFSDTYFMLLNAIKTNNTNIIQELVQQFNRDDWYFYKLIIWIKYLDSTLNINYILPLTIVIAHHSYTTCPGISAY